ncbi:MAG TPA: hypothetical protein VFQ61_19855, partial [Polyangiaceae bacterium]|nr:hypothetical protein [Polyangiaceae bacterium]
MNAWFRRLMLAVTLPLGVLGACDTGGLVGGKCRSGMLFCNSECVDPSTDARHCGACNNTCSDGASCVDGQCTSSTGGVDNSGGRSTGGNGSLEGGASGAGDTGGYTGQPYPVGGDSSGGTNSGGTSARGGVGGTGGTRPRPEAGSAGVSCDPPFDTSQHCGDCDTSCVDPNPLCSPAEMGGFECVPACPPGLLACGDQCIDPNVNPLHCGECFNLCPSGICQAGMCVGASPGHVALYCMNYSWAQPETAHTTLLGNAVYLPVRARVRVLSFSRWASANAVSQIEKVVRWSGEARGRTAQVDEMRDPAQLSARLSVQNYDVFLIQEQGNATRDELIGLGATWASTGVVDSFAKAGGVVVVLGADANDGKTAALINSLGLLDMVGQTPIALDDVTTRFYNRA